jgi:F420-dependent oxidoreductase-like protein
MRIGIALPAHRPLPDEGNSIDLLLNQAHQVAESGADTLWLSQGLDFDAIALATAIARQEPDIEIGTSIVPIYPRHPITLAAQAMTAQAASHGRFTLGIGMSSKEFVRASFGLPFDRPIRHLREYLTVLRSIFAEGTVAFDGETVTASTAIFPAALAGARPPVPILVAALGPQALRATGELGDGTITFLTGPRALAGHVVPTITAAAEKAGRPAPRIVAGVPMLLTADLDGIRATMERHLEFYGTIPSYRAILDQEGVGHPAEVAVYGDEKVLADAMRRYAEAGVTDLLISSSGIGTDEERMRTVQAVTELGREFAA